MRDQRISRHYGTAFIATVALVFATWVSAAPEFPQLTGRVVDNANLLTTATRQAISEQLKAHENASGNQVVVATVSNLQGYPIEEFGYQLGRHWALGEQGKDNGVLLLVAQSERKLRIDVGYGLESVLTDAISKTIIEADILPHFKKGDYDAGVNAGASAILRALGGQYQTNSKNKSGQKKLLPMFIFFFIVAALQIRRAFGRRRRGVMGSVLGGSVIGSSDPGRGSFGAGGGGFSGGGGGFGGGGASGGW